VTSAPLNPTQTLRIFLASPGGVEDERGVVRDVSLELSASLRQYGWQFEVLGWERRGPKGGRAQAEINEDVRRCDVFLGILGNRWGTPTGEFSSGFAEEWSIARQRFAESGQPDLWIYFKQLEVGAADSEDVRKIRSWRSEIEAQDQVFHKSFDDTLDFALLIRRRLLAEVLHRSQLTQNGFGVADIDWASVYGDEPVSLLPDGQERSALVDDLSNTHPAKAAEMLIGLASDAVDLGFESLAESFRVRACDVWMTSGDTEAAVETMRGVLKAQVWNFCLEEARLLVSQFTGTFPPELASEFRGWRACINAPGDPKESADILSNAIAAEHGFPLDRDTEALWKAVYWRCLLAIDDPSKIVSDEFEPDRVWDEVHLELSMLRADALRRVDGLRADECWKELHVRSVAESADYPEHAAWIATRRALDAIANENLEEAESRYASAATKWTKVAGARANASLAFFSAQCALQLRGDWSFTGWSWRPIAAAQLGNPMGPAARGEQLLRQALTHREDKDRDAINLLRTAIWCYQRGGFLDGEWRAQRHLASALKASGEDAEAIALLCRIGSAGDAEKIVATSTDDAEIAASMTGSWPAWTDESRFAVLAQVGSAAGQPECDGLILEAIAATDSSSLRRFDNTPARATSALAMLSLAAKEPSILERAVVKLLELARDDHYGLARPARMGLRMLDDVGLIDAADALTGLFVDDDRPDEPGPHWISEKLDSPNRLAIVRHAAFSGHRQALAALIAADAHIGDAEIRQLCAQITHSVVNSDLGMTPDGNGIHGLMALDFQGEVAAASTNIALQESFADQLLVYACESRWPMVNRLRAVEGIWPMLRNIESDSWVDALRPLADPDTDLDEQDEASRGFFPSEPGELQATALALDWRRPEMA
jgi:hypothetical protein